MKRRNVQKAIPQMQSFLSREARLIIMCCVCIGNQSSAAAVAGLGGMELVNYPLPIDTGCFLSPLVRR